MAKVMQTFTCPACGKTHELDMTDYSPGAGEYDGLCEGCEADWIMSPEYQSMLRAMGG